MDKKFVRHPRWNVFYFNYAKQGIHSLTVPEIIPPEDSSDGLSQSIFKIYIAFNSGILLYYEAKKIPTVKVTANPRRKLELRDTSLPLHTSHFFQLHVDTISVMDILVRYYELEILWALKTASLAQLNSQGTFILKFLEQFEGRLTFFHIALPPAKDWTARVSLQIEIH